MKYACIGILYSQIRDHTSLSSGHRVFKTKLLHITIILPLLVRISSIKLLFVQVLENPQKVQTSQFQLRKPIVPLNFVVSTGFNDE